MSLTKWHFSAEKWHMFSSVKFALKSCGVRKFSVMLCNLHSNPWVFWCNEKQYFLSIVSLKKKSRCIPLSLYWKQSAKVLTFQHKRPGFAVGLGNNYLNFFFHYSHSSIPRQNPDSIMLNGMLQGIFMLLHLWVEMGYMKGRRIWGKRAFH